MFNENFYESEFEEKLLILIKDNYNISKDSMLYMILRFMIINRIKNTKSIILNNFRDFILEQNNLPKDIIYKDISFSTSILNNIIQNLLFDLSKDTKNIVFIENTYQNLLNSTVLEYSKFKKNSFYEDLITLEALKSLNKLFNVHFDIFHKMDNLEYSNFNELERFYEDKLTILVEDALKHSTDYFSFITEKDVENYLKLNLNLIEPDLKFLGAQVPIKDAFIDILAEDKNNNKVLIELKIKPNDTRLIWQSIYYPLQYKKENNIDNIRMIVISPKLNESILDTLKEVPNVEYLEYEVCLLNKKIDKLILNKIL